MILAHVTDPHLPLGLPRPAEALGKRGLSLSNWLARRRRRHLAAVAARIVADLRTAAPDFIAVTGDLVNFGLEREFAAGAAWLAQLGPPSRVALVPGNHEALVRGFETPMIEHWAPYLAGDDGRTGFPWLRRRGAVALIGLSSAVPTAPGLASGRIGLRQREALARLLARTGGEGLFRIVLVHHPPTVVATGRTGLSDRDPVAAVIAAEGAELVLHGHTHRAELSWIESGAVRIPVIGAPSASLDPAQADGTGADAAAWLRFTITRADRGWQLTMHERRLTRAGTMADGARLRFRLPAPALAPSADAP